MNFEKKKLFITNVVYYLTVIIGFYFIAKLSLKYFTPFIIGGIIAYFVQKPAKFLSNKINIKRKFCAASLAVLLYLLIFSFLFLLIYLLYKNSNKIVSQIGEVFSLISKNINMFGNDISRFFDDKTQNVFHSFFSDTILKLGDSTVVYITNTIKALIKKFPSFLIVSTVTVLSTFYIAKDFYAILNFFKNLINNEKYQKGILIKKIVCENVLKLIFGYFLMMVIMFVCLIVGLFILKIEHFILIAAIIALIDLLPILGTGVIILPWSVYSILLNDIKKGIGLLILYVVLCVIRNIIEPKIIGKQIGINPLLSLISIFLGYKALGFLGIITFPIILIVIIEYYKSQYDVIS